MTVFPARQIPALLFIVIALQPMVVYAQIFKWLDNNGRIHYSDRPEGDTYETLVINHGAKADGIDQARRERRQRLLEIMEDERRARRQARETAREGARRRDYNCSLSRSNLQTVINSSYLYEESDDPLNPRVLSFEERNEATTDARATVKKWCGGPAGP